MIISCIYLCIYAQGKRGMKKALINSPSLHTVINVYQHVIYLYLNILLI